jgi:hypothetical protein
VFAAVPGRVVSISSYPERFARMPSFPSSVVARAVAAAVLAALLSAPLRAQSSGYAAGMSALPTAKHTAANPVPANLPRWACKTDCVVKLQYMDDARRLEPMAPLSAIVPTSQHRVPNNLVKRTRPPVEDAVFWSLDKSDRARHYKYKPADGTKPVQ